MLKYVTLKMLVDVPDEADLEVAITDMMAQAATPVDEESDAPAFIIDWVLDAESPACDELADLVVNGTYDTDNHDAFAPMVLGGYTEQGEFAYWNPSLGPVNHDLAQRYVCPTNDERTRTYLKNPVFLRHDLTPTLAGVPQGHWVEGRVQSDDGNYDIGFNAVPWLAVEEWAVLYNAAQAGWSGAQALDEAVYRLQATDQETRQMLVYCEASQKGMTPCGFTCTVDGEAAMSWLKANRPEIHQHVVTAILNHERACA